MKILITTTVLLAICLISNGCNERTKNGDILHALTPNMETLSETYPEHTADIEVTANTNDRLFQSDSARFWMVDEPSSLSPAPVVRD
jgi:hypothetical protein